MKIETYTNDSTKRLAIDAINNAIKNEPLTIEPVFAAHVVMDGHGDDLRIDIVNVKYSVFESKSVELDYYGEGSARYDVLVTIVCYDRDNDKFGWFSVPLSMIWEAMENGPRTTAWRELFRVGVSALAVYGLAYSNHTSA